MYTLTSLSNSHVHMLIYQQGALNNLPNNHRHLPTSHTTRGTFQLQNSQEHVRDYQTASYAYKFVHQEHLSI